MSKIKMEEYLRKAILPTFKSIDTFAKSNEIQGLVAVNGLISNYCYATKVKTEYSNIDYMIYGVETSSTGRRVYFVVNEKAYPIYTFSRSIDLCTKLEGLTKLIKEEFENKIESKDLDYIKGFGIEITEKELKENRVKSDLGMSREPIYLKECEFADGLLVDLSIPYGFLENNEIPLQDLAKKIASKPENLISLYPDEEEEYFYSSAIGCAKILVDRYFLWEGEYDEYMKEYKAKLLQEELERIIKINRNRYNEYNSFIGKKVKVTKDDKTTISGIVEVVNLKIETPIVKISNAKGSKEIFIKNIKSIKEM